MILLAVSGGPDSMFLLNEYKNKDIVVAHVNYGIRDDSGHDETIIIDFCNKHNIPYHILNAKNMKTRKNFQDAARKIRYKFFKEIYDKYHCDKLVIGHHKDDWLETAIMQKESGREPLYYGIRAKNKVDDMYVFRPLIETMWKEDIVEILDKKGIKYAIDSTNAQLIYTRNKIRARLSKHSKREKQKMINEFMKENGRLRKKLKAAIAWYNKWKKDHYTVAALKEVPKEYKRYVIFEMIYDHYNHVKVTSKKLDSFLDFVFGKDGGKKFILSKEKYVLKKDGKLIFKGDLFELSDSIKSDVNADSQAMTSNIDLSYIAKRRRR